MRLRLDFCVALLIGLLTAIAPALASGAKKAPSSDPPAAELEVAVRQEEGRSIVSIRDPEGTLPEPKITSSKRGFLLVFEGERIKRKRLEASNHRLDFVQVDQVKGRAVVRLAQARGHKGAIGDHVQQIPVPGGGLDLAVIDSLAPEAPAVPAAAPEEVVSPSAAETLASLGKNTTSTSTTPSEEPSPAAEPPGSETTSVSPEAEKPGTALGSEPATTAAPLAEAEETTPSWLSDPETEGTTRTWAWLLVPVVIAGGVAFFWSKKAGRRDPSEGMHVLEKVSLGPKQHIVRMRVADRELLLGVTEHQVGLITEVRSDAKALSAPGGATGPTVTGLPAADQGSKDRVAAFKNRLASALRTEATTRGNEPAETLAADGDEWVSEIPGSIDIDAREVA